MASNNALIKAAQAGNSQAQNELVKENIAYIKKIVGSIPNLNQSYYDDLVQEGCLGLLKAIEKFGPMIMTSLNESGEEPIIKYSDALEYKNTVDFIVKGSDLHSIPSTVYDAINNKVLRQGSIKI